MKRIFLIFVFLFCMQNFFAQTSQAVDTAFDAAVKKRVPEWKGYANYGSQTELRAQILNKIDSLDLSQNALLLVPQEVAECKNLKLMNLLGNPDIDWKQSTETFAKLGSQVGMYVSVYDLSAIDSAYWQLVTGIELLQKLIGKDEYNSDVYHRFDNIPTNILQQKQLVYLDLSGNSTYLYIVTNFFSDITSVCNLTQLRYLNLQYCNLKELPIEIRKLTNLTSLDLEGNKLTTLPVEIGNLQNLRSLDLKNNQLSTLPNEIGKLTNLTYLDLRYNYALDNTSVCNIFSKFPKKIQLTTGYIVNSEIDELIILLPNFTTFPSEIGNITN